MKKNVQFVNKAGPTQDTNAAEKTNFEIKAYLTKGDVAALLRVTVRTIDEWMSRGLLPYLKVGRTVRFKAADVESHLATHFRIARRSL